IEAAQRDDVVRHYENTYHTGSLVVTAAGAVDHDAFVATVIRGLERARSERWSLRQDRQPNPRRDRSEPPMTAPAAVADGTPRVVLTEKPGEQVHLMLGTRGLQTGDDRRFAHSMMNAVLGGGMSSRLFQEIREKRGL